MGALILCGLFTGCSSNEGSQQYNGGVMSSEQVKELGRQESDSGNTEQAAVLADGSVSFEEYDESFNLLAGCLRNVGIEPSAPLMSPVSGNRYEFSMNSGELDPQSALADGDVCQAKYWSSVSQAYSFSTPDVMEAALRTSTSECLEKKGIETTGGETNAKAFADLPGVDPDVLSSCILDAATEMYPEYPSMTVAF
ncbi:hypothetical protein E3T28_08205 [Cryobacterium sinapicolor]|uniref:Lipoprotein n=1 Tax=Cryobacterium sinapicolor TaxID=1259236 RepID=A0ABY2J9K6_9MICO|nr:hypothetical protein [Cryobacterium sinapicolor]TFD00501.1 hypothetical protein E3T28_08205 [Cryobacterium sinapicolor]